MVASYCGMVGIGSVDSSKYRPLLYWSVHVRPATSLVAYLSKLLDCRESASFVVIGIESWMLFCASRRADRFALFCTIEVMRANSRMRRG